MLFACSGAADVGLLADQTARALTKQGLGKMYCLAGVGGKIPSMIERVRSSGRRVAIDGCPSDCAKHSLLGSGIQEFDHIRLYEHGFEKGKTSVTQDSIARAAALVQSELAVK